MSIVYIVLALLTAFNAQKAWTGKNLQLAAEMGTTYEPGLLGRVGLFLIAVVIEVVFYLPIRFLGIKGAILTMLLLSIFSLVIEYLVSQVIGELMAVAAGTGFLGMPAIAATGADKTTWLIYFVIFICIFGVILSFGKMVKKLTAEEADCTDNSQDGEPTTQIVQEEEPKNPKWKSALALVAVAIVGGALLAILWMVTHPTTQEVATTIGALPPIL